MGMDRHRPFLVPTREALKREIGCFGTCAGPSDGGQRCRGVNGDGEPQTCRTVADKLMAGKLVAGKQRGNGTPNGSAKER